MRDWKVQFRSISGTQALLKMLSLAEKVYLGEKIDFLRIHTNRFSFSFSFEKLSEDDLENCVPLKYIFDFRDRDPKFALRQIEISSQNHSGIVYSKDFSNDFDRIEIIVGGKKMDQDKDFIANLLKVLNDKFIFLDIQTFLNEVNPTRTLEQKVREKLAES